MDVQELKQTVIWYLENYWNLIMTIANFRNDILYAGTMRDLEVPITSGMVSDTVLKKAVKLIDNDIDVMMDWIKVINETYYYFRETNAKKADLIYYTYIQKNPKYKTRAEIIDRLFISRRAYYEWLNDICQVAGYKAAGRKLIEF
jgi:hypothetical protein